VGESDSGIRVVPEQGQLVDVRRRQFIVSEVRRSSLDPSHLRNGSRPAQHLITLSSIEDDAYGDELQVIWEIEPGARVIEDVGLPQPDGFDDPDRLDAFLNAVRWGAVTDADLQALQSPFRSGITIEDYQLDPVVRAIQMPRANLLIADDVGLGKTIEAGLVIQELLLRHRARSVLIVCPANLQLKWRDEMRDKFGLEFRIVDTELLKELRRSRGIRANPWTHFPRLITSMDWLKLDTPMRLFRDVLPAQPTYPRPFDILVVDEAANIAPSGSGRYALDSLRTQAVRSLVPHFEHKLFLTATPHNGYRESFTSLLELLDNQRFAVGVVPDPERLAVVMVRRLKDEIVDWRGEPRFPKRVLEAIEVDYSDDERAVHAALQEYTRLRQESSKQNGGGYATEFVLKLIKKRLFSSPAAFAKTLSKHRRTITEGKRQRAPGADVEKRILRRAINQLDEDYADDLLYEDRLDDALAAAEESLPQISERELQLLDSMSTWAERASQKPDSKAFALLDWLDANIRPHGDWTDERVIIFTEYRTTQTWLAGILASRDYGGERLMQLYGGMDDDERERIKAAFQAHPDSAPVRILLATDAASEGIDLQNHCSNMIHIEIPWNPNRLEQRNGRIDRHGQKAKEVLIHHFVGAGYGTVAREDLSLEGDLEYLLRAVKKTESIREDLGKVGPVIAQQVAQAMLGRRTTLDTRAAEQEAAAARKEYAIDRRVAERIQRLHERLAETREKLNLSPESVQRVVEVGLELAGQPPLRAASLPDLAPGIGPVFRMPLLSGTWGRCSDGLAHPHTGERRLITFDHRAIEGRDDIVLVHLEHRLAQMCLRLLRAEIWARGEARQLFRVAARTVPDDVLDTPAVVAQSRLVVIGDDRHRLHEEIIETGGVVRQGRFARLNVEQTRRALSEAGASAAGSSVARDLAVLWPRLQDSLVASLEARREDRLQHLLNTLERRRQREVDDMAQVLEELQASIRAELEEPEEQQQTLWTSAERDQLVRNLDDLRARVDAIPDEIDKEAEQINARYRKPIARLFPVAVILLVPESLVDA
jgi:superfamily II DNA/RNA helicase